MSTATAEFTDFDVKASPTAVPRPGEQKKSLWQRMKSAARKAWNKTQSFFGWCGRKTMNGVKRTGRVSVRASKATGRGSVRVLGWVGFVVFKTVSLVANIIFTIALGLVWIVALLILGLVLVVTIALGVTAFGFNKYAVGPFDWMRHSSATRGKFGEFLTENYGSFKETFRVSDLEDLANMVNDAKVDLDDIEEDLNKAERDAQIVVDNDPDRIRTYLTQEDRDRRATVPTPHVPRHTDPDGPGEHYAEHTARTATEAWLDSGDSFSEDTTTTGVTVPRREQFVSYVEGFTTEMMEWDETDDHQGFMGMLVEALERLFPHDDDFIRDIRSRETELWEIDFSFYDDLEALGTFYEELHLLYGQLKHQANESYWGARSETLKLYRKFPTKIESIFSGETPDEDYETDDAVQRSTWPLVRNHLGRNLTRVARKFAYAGFRDEHATAKGRRNRQLGLASATPFS